MTGRIPRGTDKSIGIEKFLDEMQPSVNKMYLEWKQAGLNRLDFLDEIVMYLDETTFAFDGHGNMEKTETRQQGISKMALLLFVGAAEAADENPLEFINKK